MNKTRALAVFASLAILVLAISQTSSYLVNAKLAVQETYVVNSFIYFTHVRNLGGTFGLFQGSGWLIAIFSAAILLGITLYLILSKNTKFYEFVCFGIIVGAGASNVLDRIIYGGVVDFIDIQHIPYWHYIFNTADVMIHVGIWPLLICSFLQKA